MGAAKRYQRADRSRPVRATRLDDAVAIDHPVRAVWEFIDRLPLSAFYADIRAVEGGSGRPPVDPKILLCLWIWAIKEGVGSARYLEELSCRDSVYAWICGGVHVNHHLLSAFRVSHEKKLDTLLSRILAVLTKHGLVRMKRVCQDGTRVRASAGAASFRRESTLRGCLKAAREQVEAVREEQRRDSTACRRAQLAAQRRAAEERSARVSAALREVPSLREARARQDKADPKRAAKREAEVRASTTDADARVLKMPDGGFRPAYNLQLVVDEATDVIAGVLVSNAGTDAPLLLPALDDACRRTGATPRQMLVDGGYVEWGNLSELERRAIVAYAPVRVPRNPRVDPYKPKADDPPVVARWRRRMATSKAQELYKRRAASSERVNADLKEHRGLRSFPVRGLARVRAVALLTVIAYDVERCIHEGWTGKTNYR